MVDNRLAALPRPTLQEPEFARQRGFIGQFDPALSEERMCFEICLRLRAFGVLVVDALSLKGSDGQRAGIYPAELPLSC